MVAINLKRKCPICTNAKGQVLNTQQFLLPDNHPLRKGYDVVTCDACGFVYADTDSTQNDYDKFYNSFSKYEEGASIIGSGDSPFDYQRLNATARYLSSKVGSDDSVIDVGCANGGLLREFQKNGYRSLTAYDPSSYCINYIKKNLGIVATLGSIFGIDRSEVYGRKYDLVILSHVLEHLLDVEGAFRQIDNLLKKGSMLYIEVPDASKYTQYFVSPLHYFDTEHINHFSAHYLRLLATRFGLEILDQGEKEIPLSDNTIYPAIFILLKKPNDVAQYSHSMPTYDDSLTANTRAYINKSLEGVNLELIKQISNDSREYVFWGVGSTTLRLLASTDLKHANIKFFVDNNPKTHSNELLGKKIYSPTILKDHRDPIVIFTRIYKNEILKQLRETLKVENELIFIN